MRHQGPAIRTLTGTILRGLLQTPAPRRTERLRGEDGASTRRHSRTIDHVSRRLIADYLDWCGADRDRYAGTIPPHLFPQWTMPVLGRALSSLPYPIARVLNAGCRMRLLAPLPAGSPLLVTALAPSVQDDGHRALIRARTTTGTRADGDLLLADVYALVPLKSRVAAAKKKRPCAPSKAEIIGRVPLGGHAGLEYACLSGDFNPIHWLPPAAWAAGFPRPILQGFATMALAFERLVDARGGGDPWSIRALDVRFTSPLVLPCEASFYIADQYLTVASAPGQPAFLTGTFELS